MLPETLSSHPISLEASILTEPSLLWPRPFPLPAQLFCPWLQWALGPPDIKVGARSFTSKPQSLTLSPTAPEGSHLGDEELARGELPPGHLHLAMAFHLEVLQLPAPLDHRLDLRLDLADVESGHGELLLDGPTDLHRLQGAREGAGALLRETSHPFPSTVLLPAHTTCTGTRVGQMFSQQLLAALCHPPFHTIPLPAFRDPIPTVTLSHL